MCSLAGINNVRSLYLRITPPSARETPSASGLGLPSVCMGGAAAGRTREGQEGTLSSREGWPRGRKRLLWYRWQVCRPKEYDLCQRGYCGMKEGNGLQAREGEAGVRHSGKAAHEGWRYRGPHPVPGDVVSSARSGAPAEIPVFPSAGTACPCGNLPAGLHGSPAKGHGAAWFSGASAFFSGGNAGRQGLAAGQGHVPFRALPP